MLARCAMAFVLIEHGSRALWKEQKKKSQLKSAHSKIAHHVRRHDVTLHLLIKRQENSEHVIRIVCVCVCVFFFFFFFFFFLSIDILEKIEQCLLVVSHQHVDVNQRQRRWQMNGFRCLLGDWAHVALVSVARTTTTQCAR
jgi:hypothetical protein